MPRFTFATQYGDTDVARLELPSVKEAWHQAVESTGEALRDIDGHMGLPDDFVMTVSNEMGSPLFELRCTTRRLASDDAR
jgi:hypothetical protein